jgi:hypothetical protein
MTESSDARPTNRIAITFAQPDVIHDIHEALLETWGGDPFLAIKNVGFFIRVVLPVKLSDGSIVDFGTWLEVHSEDFRTAWRTWNAPEYADLSVEGYVANEIAPWGRLPHELVTASVVDVDEIPHLVSTANPIVTRILEETWPAEEVLAPYADLLSEEPAPDASEGRAKAGDRSLLAAHPDHQDRGLVEPVENG